MSEIYDWNSQDPEAGIVLRQQPATAVYLNTYGHLVLRQEDQYGDRDDCITIAPANVGAIAEAMFDAAGINASITYHDRAHAPLMLPKPEALSGAERQKRYRKKHRNGISDEQSDELPLQPITNGHHVCEEVLHATA